METIIQIIQYSKDNTISYNSMIGESLLLLKGHSRSHVTCTAQVKTESFINSEGK